MQSPPLQQTSVLIEHIQELHETSTIIAVAANEIQELAFVFHPEHLIQEAFSAFGIFNFVLCRFKRDQFSSSLHELSKEDINPFTIWRIDEPLKMWSLPHCASYSRIIFDDLSSFQDSLWRIFNYTSQKQGHVCRNGDKVRVQMETWEYLCRNLSRKVPNLSFVACTTKSLRRNTSSDGRRSTQRKVRAATKCVLLTEEELSAFAAIVGPSTMSGVRKMRPSVAVAYQDLLENDKMNVVRHLSAKEDKATNVFAHGGVYHLLMMASTSTSTSIILVTFMLVQLRLVQTATFSMFFLLLPPQASKEEMHNKKRRLMMQLWIQSLF